MLPFILKPRRADKTKAQPKIPTDIAGISVKPSARAKRMALRVDQRSGDIILIWPLRRTSLKSAEKFVAESQSWILKQTRARQKEQSETALTQAGGTLCVLGKDYILEQGQRRGLTRIEGDKIIVTGDPLHFQRRLATFLRTQAKNVYPLLVSRKTDEAGLHCRQVRVADPKSRWGSCTSDGVIMLSWRLLLAPPEVMDYVIAHEVAHLRHMDHSMRFWKLCLSLCTGDGNKARLWMKKNANKLQRLL